MELASLIPSTPSSTAATAAFINAVSVIKATPGVITSSPRFAKAAYNTLNAPVKKLPRAIIDRKNFEYYHSPVEGSKTTIVFPMGHGTKIEDAQEAIADFNAMGINVITIPCPEMNRRKRSADGRKIDKVYQDHIKNCVFNPDSPIYDLIPDDHKAAIIFHSASAEAAEILMEKNDNHAKFLESKFGDRKINTGILLDTFSSSEGHHPKKSKAYKKYTRVEAVDYQLAGSTELDQIFLGITEEEKEAHIKSIQANATHGQARVLKDAGADCVTRIKENLNLDSTFNKTSRICLSGQDEDSACVDTIKDVCNLVKGAQSAIVPNIKHNPIFESAAIRAIIGDALMNNKPFKAELFDPMFRTLQETVQAAIITTKTRHWGCFHQQYS